MNFRLVSVGKPRDAETRALHDRYARRIRRFGVGYESLWVPEVAGAARYTEEHVREREAAALLDKLEGRGRVIALDPAGESLDSAAVARRLERWATPRASLVIGGPSGLHANVLTRADVNWSLSPLTFPHELVRVLVAEQLYRALTILRETPYHK